MKPVKRLYLGGDEVFINECNVVLELNACGRGFITVKTNQDYTGKLVRLDVGYSHSLLRWFTGYVESSQPADMGHQRLFVREIIHLLDKKMSCAFQHPTLKNIIDWMTEQTNIQFSLPNMNYVNKPVPHFTQTGTGYQILSNLGRVFSIPDYVYQPLPDGSVYIGDYNNSLFANKPVNIPVEFTLKSTGRSLTFPIVQSIRPGVIVNNKRLNRVDLNNDEMVIYWDDNKETQRSPEQRQIDKLYPELNNGLHLPMQAQIVAYSDSAGSGDFSDSFRPRYAVNLQMLDENGQPDKKTPVFPAVPLPIPMAGNECGQFQYPSLGVKVEVGFMSGRQDQPFIKQILSNDLILPAIKPGEQLQQQRDGVYQKVTLAGDIHRQTDQSLIDDSNARVINANTESTTLMMRNAEIATDDITQVGGTSKLLAGTIQQLATNDHSIVSLADIIEKATGLKKSIAGIQQQIIAPQVWIGSESVNTLTLLVETLDLIKTLTEALAIHTHPLVPPPVNAADITAVGMTAATLKAKYQPVIA